MAKANRMDEFHSDKQMHSRRSKEHERNGRKLQGMLEGSQISFQRRSKGTKKKKRKGRDIEEIVYEIETAIDVKDA